MTKLAYSSIFFCLFFVVFSINVCFGKEKENGGGGGAQKEKVTKLQIGIKKRVEDCTKKSRKGDVLHVHYTGTLEDGTEFDSSRKRDNPFIFSLGMGQVIKSWDQGMLNMCEGERRKLVIPPDMGYGTHGSPPTIPANAVLTFDVELIRIERNQQDL